MEWPNLVQVNIWTRPRDVKAVIITGPLRLKVNFGAAKLTKSRGLVILSMQLPRLVTHWGRNTVNFPLPLIISLCLYVSIAREISS